MSANASSDFPVQGPLIGLLRVLIGGVMVVFGSPLTLFMGLGVLFNIAEVAKGNLSGLLTLLLLLGATLVGVGLVGLGGFLVIRELARLTRRAWAGT